MHRIRRACGDDFIIGLAVNDEPDVLAALGREALAEVIALHDAEQAMDYVTCGSGSYFDFYKLMPTFLYPEKLGVDLAHMLKGVVNHAVVTAESHIHTPQKAEEVLGPQVARLLDFLPDQPQRRAQNADLLGWYKRQLDQLGVDVRLNTYLDPDEIAAFGADHIALPTGSQPDPGWVSAGDDPFAHIARHRPGARLVARGGAEPVDRAGHPDRSG